jgi:hypothetical protein
VCVWSPESFATRYRIPLVVTILAAQTDAAFAEG